MTFDELEPGHLIKYVGLILATNGNDDFFKGRSITMIDYNDPYWGTCHRGVKPDEDFEILHEKGTPEYIEVINELIKGRAEYIKDASDDILKLESFK